MLKIVITVSIIDHKNLLSQNLIKINRIQHCLSFETQIWWKSLYLTFKKIFQTKNLSRTSNIHLHSLFQVLSAVKTRSDESLPPSERSGSGGYPTTSPWPALSLPAPELDPVAAAWGRKLYSGSAGAGPRVAAGPGLMFGLHHHQDHATGGLHHHHQPRGPSLKEEPLSSTRAWMQPSVQDQTGWATILIYCADIHLVLFWYLRKNVGFCNGWSYIYHIMEVKVWR